jgi:hypothetical protein
VDAPNDFRELLELLNAHKVDYLVVGAFALAHHGVPRYTGDLDILVKPDDENVQRLVACLNEFGFSSLGLQAADFTQPEQVVQLGVSPVRVDFLNSLTGVTWQEAFDGRIRGTLADIPVYFLGKDALFKNKKILGRKKDLADLEALEENANGNNEFNGLNTLKDLPKIDEHKGPDL